MTALQLLAIAILGGDGIDRFRRDIGHDAADRDSRAVAIIGAEISDMGRKILPALDALADLLAGGDEIGTGGIEMRVPRLTLLRGECRRTNAGVAQFPQDRLVGGRRRIVPQHLIDHGDEIFPIARDGPYQVRAGRRWTGKPALVLQRMHRRIIRNPTRQDADMRGDVIGGRADHGSPPASPRQSGPAIRMAPPSPPVVRVPT